MNSLPRVLLVEDDALLREQLALAMREQYEVSQASSPDSAASFLDEHTVDLVLLDLQLTPNGSTEDGFGVLRRLKQQSNDTIVIVMTGNRDRNARLRAIESGAFDCFMKPFDLREMQLVAQRGLERLELERENRRLRAEMYRQASFQQLVGRSPAMVRVFETIRRVADSPATVMIQGESGTGKELVARAIHLESGRRSAPFVPVHCSALPETLIETELFGHEKGAYTGADVAREGRFEMAHGGTLFLDEISTLNQNVQMKLLRVLEEREFERIGGRKTIRVDVRLVTATNENLEELVRRGTFREDLFFRLNVLPLPLPPLRERREDIPLLADHFLQQYCSQFEVPRKKLSDAALACMMNHVWKGNVRELENVVQRCILLADGPLIEPANLPAAISGEGCEAAGVSTEQIGDGFNLLQAMAQKERELLLMALKQSGGVKTQAAKKLGLTREQLKYLCRKHAL